MFKPEVEKPYSVGDVARKMGVNERTVRRWADQGKLPYFRTLGTHRRFRRSDIDALLSGAVEDGAA